MEEIFIDEKYLKENPNHIFVFGDNLLRVGMGGAAKLRHMPNTYGFITKKTPSHDDKAYFRPDDEYSKVLNVEIKKLLKEIGENPNKTYLISKLGSKLANKYQIFEKMIKGYLIKIHNAKIKNIKFLFDINE